MKKQLFMRALSLLMAIFLAAGSVFVMPATEVSAAAAPRKIALNAKKKTIGVGQTFKLKVKSAVPKKASKKVAFKSSNKKVATVKSNGTVKGIKAGTAKITVTSKAKKTVRATCKVTVAAINVSKAKKGILSVKVNESVAVKPSMKPSSVKVAGYTYSIKDKATATVAKSGKVTGVKEGRTTLTIRSGKKKKTDPVFTLKLTVKVSGSSDDPQDPGDDPGNTDPTDPTEPTDPDNQDPDDDDEVYDDGPEAEIPDVDDPSAIKRWKFDFGSKTDVASGYTAVTADKDYWASNNKDGYGFMGINKEASQVSNRYDGFGNQVGQVQELQTGGGTGLNDAIGCAGIVGQQDELGDEYYPTRFALKVPDDTYYKVTATVTTLDPKKDAKATLYTERKHPIYTDKKITAGETNTAVFTIRVTPVYYQKSEPYGLIADEMVNVCVSGDNTALAALKIEQLSTAPVLWVLGDSTVTDGNATLPFFRLQNYTGVGTGLTKYLPGNIAMVNEGEGGLNAADNLHFNVVKDRIKSGDWLYVEYGHNHKSENGVEEYTGYLDKYYDLCEQKGAKLLVVSPIERINIFSDGVYQHSLEGFARAGENYVKEKVSAGKKNIAFVDLNKTSYEFYNKITTDNGGDANAIKFYFCTLLGGKTDATHPNDAGAENLANCFFEAAQAVTDETQKAVLSGLLNGMRTQKPRLVSKKITSLGPAPNAAWPVYTMPVDEKYPVAVRNIKFDPDGNISYVKVKVQQALTTMSAYGIIAVTISNASGVKGVFYANDQVDNSTGYGTQIISSFRTENGSDLKCADGDTFSVVVYQAHRDANNLLVKDDDNIAYSKVYESVDIPEEYLLPGENDDVEDFSYSAQKTLTDSGKWSVGGSSSSDLSLGRDANGKAYTNLTITDPKGSWVVSREFENLVENGINIGTGKNGRYMIEADLKYISGSNLKFSFVENVTNGYPFISGKELDAFVIGTNGTVTSHGTALKAKFTPNEWTHIKYILNMDNGTAEITIGDNAAETVFENYYRTDEVDQLATLRYLAITQAESRSSFSAQLSNLTVAKLRDAGYRATINTSITGCSGKVKINGQEAAAQEKVPLGSKTEFEAVSEGDSAFYGWYMDGKLYSTQRKIWLKAYRTINLEARFEICDEFEDFSGSELTPANWGFTPGTSGNVAWQNDGTLGLFLKGAINKENSDVKTLSTAISSAKKITVWFDWVNDVEYNVGRSSSFNLRDSSGNVIFSIFAQGNKGVFCAVNGVAAETSTKVSGDSRDWSRVKLTIDFNAKRISGTVIDLTTGAETTIAQTTLTAVNLAKLSADYGYSLAPQRLDNFAIRYTQ